LASRLSLSRRSWIALIAAAGITLPGCHPSVDQQKRHSPMKHIDSAYDPISRRSGEFSDAAPAAAEATPGGRMLGHAA
jgi:hypothetical protein